MRDNLDIFAMLAVLGAVPLAIALLTGSVFGLDVVLGALVLVVGLVGLVAHATRGRKEHLA